MRRPPLAGRGPALLTGVGVVVGLVVAVLLYRGYGGGSAGVASGVRSFSVLSDDRVRVVFEVAKARDAAALCTVRARDRDGQEAGTAVVRVPPSPQRPQVVTYDLVTSSRAVTGEVTGCGLDPGTGGG